MQLKPTVFKIPAMPAKAKTALQEKEISLPKGDQRQTTETQVASSTVEAAEERDVPAIQPPADVNIEGTQTVPKQEKVGTPEPEHSAPFAEPMEGGAVEQLKRVDDPDPERLATRLEKLNDEISAQLENIQEASVQLCLLNNRLLLSAKPLLRT